MENYGTIWVCMDCMLHHANGECGGCHDDHGHDEDPLGLIDHVEGFHVAMGMAHEEHSCPRNGDDCWDIDVDVECYCETSTFSESRCEGCGSWLHGERHAMTLFKG